MRKFSKYLIILFICVLSAVFFCSCGEHTGNNTNGGGNNQSAATEKLSDYALPENFALTYMMTDTKIINPGDPWYFKTAKIGNDWQILEYNRDLAHDADQATHFFKYISDDNYSHYTYDFGAGAWVASGNVTFSEMTDVSSANFAFLYTKPVNTVIEITETEIKYDTDHTSNENLIDAVRYEYSDTLDFDYVVDKAYLNICLSDTCRDGSTVCVENRAYDYSKSIDSWTISYMSNLGYKPAPTL